MVALKPQGEIPASPSLLLLLGTKTLAYQTKWPEKGFQVPSLGTTKLEPLGQECKGALSNGI